MKDNNIEVKKKNNYVNNIKEMIENYIFYFISYYKTHKISNINIGRELADIILDIILEKGETIYKDFINRIKENNEDC